MKKAASSRSTNTRRHLQHGRRSPRKREIHKHTSQSQSSSASVCVCVCETCGEPLMVKAQPPGCSPPQSFHLLAVLELVDLLQRRAVLLHALHVAAAVLEEAQQLVVDDVLVLRVCEDNTPFQKGRSGASWWWNLIRTWTRTWSPPQALLEGLHAAHTSVLGAAPQADPLQVILQQQGREQRQETRRQLAKLRLPLGHQLTWWRQWDRTYSIITMVTIVLRKHQATQILLSTGDGVRT